MKGNIKKLSVLVGVLVIALFIMVVMASAGPAIPYSIKGVYAVTGFTSCSIAGGPAGPGIMEGDYTFRKDGTGSATGWIRNIPPMHMYYTVDFTYAVTQDGDITFTYPNPPGGTKVYFPDKTREIMQWDGGPSHGVISPDGKTITITCGPPILLTVIDSPNGPSVGTVGDCVTSAVGMRMN
jgi:hypothetical protein